MVILRRHSSLSLVLSVVLSGLTLACSNTSRPAPGEDSLGGQTAAITADTEVLRQAQAAVNAVVREAGNCPAANAAIPGAEQELDSAAQKVQTAAGRQSLDTMRKQIRSVAEACAGVDQ
jgi:hypothetical protein